MRRLAYLAPLAAFGVLVAAFAAGLGRDPSRLPSTLIGKPLPDFSLPSVNADQAGLRARELRGVPRLLNVFASWCVACREEHPVLLQLSAQGVPIEGLDWKDAPADGAQYLAREGDPYRRVGADPSGRTGIDLGVAGVPETFVVDAQGHVAFKQVGPISEADWTQTIGPLMARLKEQR